MEDTTMKTYFTRMIAVVALSLLFALNALADSPCFDYTDLSSAKCETASFDDQERLRSWNANRVDNGPEASTSRHTVHTDPLELDARTAYQLRTTLPDGRPSVRLGNWDINKQAERITYSYTVPEDNPVLILYYAVVLEDPGHEEEAQPRFTMDLLQNGVPAQSECFSFDFKSGFDMDSASWHLEMPGICWKDWTMMGVSLADFAGQTVQLQFTTYDCSKGEHYGYAYFGIECRSNKMETTSCGSYEDSDAATFIAPDGFNYRWYLPSDPETTLSTERTFHHTGATATYYCDIINKENENCYFTLQATPEARYPIAEFAFTQQITECADTIYVTNLSGVSADGVSKKDPIEDCDNYLWDFGDGRTSTDKEPVISYSAPGTYTLSLIAGLNDWQCASSEYTATITVEPRAEAGKREVTMCEGERMLWHGKEYTEEGEYADPLGNGLCDSVLILTVNPIGKSVVYDTICHGDAYSWRGATLSQAGVYTDTAYNKTADGCDSVYYLNLAYYTRYDRVPQELQDRMNTAVSRRRDVSYYSSNAEPWDDPYMLVHIDHETVNAATFDWHGKTYTESGVYADTLKTVQHGCDSIVFLDLTLTLVPTMTVVPESDSFCKGDVYIWVGRDSKFASLTEGGEYRDTVVAPVTLDTTLYVLTLTELQPSADDVRLTICDKQLPYTWNGITCNSANDYTYTTTNAAGCDSIVTLHLKVDTYSASDTTASICAAELPYKWHGKTLTEAGTATDVVVNSVGCDSIITLTLKVLQPSASSENVTVCDTLLPYIWNGIRCTETKDYTYTTTNKASCDSVVTLHLTVITCERPEPEPEPEPEPDCNGLQAVVTMDTLCANDKYLPIDIQITSGKWTNCSAVFDENAKAQGFEDITSVTMLGNMPRIPVPRQADTTQYVRPDNYTMTLSLTDTCGKVNNFTLGFTVLYPSWIILQRWNDVLALLNDRYNGGYVFSSIRWFHEGQELEGKGEHHSYVYILPNLSYQEAHWAELTRADDGKTFRTCYIYPRPAGNGTTFATERVRLNIISSRRYGITTDLNGHYTVYHVSGCLIQTGVFGSVYGSPDLKMDVIPTGTYIVVFRSDDGVVETKKLFVD